MRAYIDAYDDDDEDEEGENKELGKEMKQKLFSLLLFAGFRLDGEAVMHNLIFSPSVLPTRSLFHLSQLISMF